MSDLPPPPGSNPPPPPPGPPGGGYPPPPPPGSGSGSPTPGYTGGGTLAEWPQRALGLLVDIVPIIALEIAVFIVAAILGRVAGPLGLLVSLVGWLAVLAYYVIQLIKQGNTGQTIGKKIIGLKLIKEDTGQPVGPGLSIVRYFAHFIDSLICYIGWFFPLWDAKKQTIADKLMGTVVLTVPKQPFDAKDLYTTT